jgi:hypothetical protein
MKKLLPTVTCTLLLAGAPLAQAADAERGKKLVAENCTACHDDSVYTRKQRRVNSMDDLKKQVKRCEFNLDLAWFDEDVSDVVSYLNSTYYKF